MIRRWLDLLLLDFDLLDLFLDLFLDFDLLDLLLLDLLLDFDDFDLLDLLLLDFDFVFVWHLEYVFVLTHAPHLQMIAVIVQALTLDFIAVTVFVVLLGEHVCIGLIGNAAYTKAFKKWNQFFLFFIDFWIHIRINLFIGITLSPFGVCERTVITIGRFYKCDHII